MNIKDFAQQFAQKSKPSIKCGNVFSEGNACYPYGRHYPIAFLRGSRAFINSDSYSRSTSRQVSRITSALSSAGYELSPRDTAELKALIAGREE